MKCFAVMVLIATLNLWFWDQNPLAFVSKNWSIVSPKEFLYVALTHKVALPPTKEIPHQHTGIREEKQRPNASLASFLYPAGSEDTCIQEVSQPGVLPFKDIRDLRSMPVHAFYINVAAHKERRQRIEQRFEAAAREYGIGDKDTVLHGDLRGGQSQDHRRGNELGVGSAGKRMGEYHLHRIDAATNCAEGKYHCVVQSHLRAIETASNYLSVDKPNEFQDFALIMEDDMTLELEAFWSAERGAGMRVTA